MNFADVFKPELRRLLDKAGHQRDTIGIVHFNDLYPGFFEPIQVAFEVDRFADHHRADIELPD